ncbi:hypothetical protein EVD20_04395 [Elizabethkingia bruuniana]|nr:hypothetical protein EVD20_04395 [Elizabethkingia bruuniana]
MFRIFRPKSWNNKSSSTFFLSCYLFRKGYGENLIDFKTYEVAPEKIFFMRPDQIHSWRLDENAEGYVINFSTTFLINLRLILR